MMTVNGANTRRSGDVRILSLYSETSLHPGTGQSTGAIDLPVERERHTGIPLLAGSGLKGSLREAGETLWGKGSREVALLFGPQDGDLHGGALSISEAHLLAFPVRSLAEVFVWVICPLVLNRLRRDVALAGIDGLVFPVLSAAAEAVLVPENSALSSLANLALEDISLIAKTDKGLAKLAADLADVFLPPVDLYKESRDRLANHLLLVTDTDFFYLVRHATQIAARIKLTSRKTTGEIINEEGLKEKGNLWYEETLPRDCLFYAIVRAQVPSYTEDDGIRTASDVSIKFSDLINELAYLQIGGNETVGQGWCRLHMVALPISSTGRKEGV